MLIVCFFSRSGNDQFRHCRGSIIFFDIFATCSFNWSITRFDANIQMVQLVFKLKQELICSWSNIRFKQIDELSTFVKRFISLLKDMPHADRPTAVYRIQTLISSFYFC